MTFDQLWLCVFLLATGFAACLMPAQDDTWWHLRAGEEMWRTGVISLHDTFSHTASGAYWPNHEWLSEVLAYGLYRSGGLPLVTAVAAGLVVATWVIVLQLTRGSAIRRFVICTLGMVPFSIALSVRPHVLTLFFTALTALLLTRQRYRLLPFLFLLWANLHGGVVIGLVLLGAANLGTLITERRVLLPLALASVACFVATCVTPLGLFWLQHFATSISHSRLYGTAEWRPPGLLNLELIPFWVLSAALVVLVAVEQPWRRSGSPAGPTLWGALAMLPLAMYSIRNVPPLMLLAVPAVAALVDRRLSPRVEERQRKDHPGFNALAVAIASIAVTLAVGYAWTVQLPRLGWHPLPESLVAAAESCPENLYNRYDEGGYLIWFVRTHRVFLDTRQEPYPSDLVLDQIRAESTGDYEDLFRRYAIRCAFIPSGSLVANRLRHDGWHVLQENGGWAVLAEDRSALMGAPALSVP